uniref:Uncharacterized protein n=1 Tax=Sander lucioperca TaxID=283035 RepID=A0A8D0D4Z0_SANLU
MSSETTGQTVTVKTGEAVAATGPAAVKGEWKCPMGDGRVHRDDVRKVWKECHKESFWYRACPAAGRPSHTHTTHTHTHTHTSTAQQAEAGEREIPVSLRETCLNYDKYAIYIRFSI